MNKIIQLGLSLFNFGKFTEADLRLALRLERGNPDCRRELIELEAMR